jgi:hypothetical protein
MKSNLIAALVLAVSSHSYAQVAGDIDFDCSDYYGLNVCGASFESSDNQISSIEQNPGTSITLQEKHGPLFKTSLTDEDMNQINRENTFKNSDSFRAYMKTLGSTDSTNTNSEFTVTKRIVDNNNFGLDCRLVTHTIYELSSSTYYDCSLQRYF